VGDINLARPENVMKYILSRDVFQRTSAGDAADQWGNSPSLPPNRTLFKLF